ncbi:hypothetical protein [Arthrobacter alpinus]|uniref:hypothetical protein n=1 Tax=Arthrobacter alpinus TaxID=656366 RepID=UPI0021BD8E91|nr:hypothetical protein [Arthrobacter alpinus]
MVTFFGEFYGRAMSTFDLSDVTFGEVHQWAKKNASDETLIGIALVSRDARGMKGLTWLLGMDPNCEPLSDIQFRMRDEMTADSTSSGHTKPAWIARSDFP